MRDRLVAESRALVTGPDRQDRVRALTREARFRTTRQTRLEVEWPSGRYLVSTDDMVVSLRTYVDGPYELAHLVEVVRQVERVTGHPVRGRDVLEIGANIGTTTVPLITEIGAARVIAIEPVPANCELLSRTIALNGLDDRVAVYRVALSDREGSIGFQVMPRNSGSGHIATDAAMTVPATTVDALINTGTVSLERLGLVWMDVEGHEPSVLAGASRLLAALVPVVIEYWPETLPAAELDRLHALVADNFTHVMPTGFDELIPASDMQQLDGRFPHHIDVILLSL